MSAEDVSDLQRGSLRGVPVLGRRRVCEHAVLPFGPPPGGQSRRIDRAPRRPQVFPGHARVAHRRGDRGVTEELLDDPDVGPGIEQMGREAMPLPIIILPMNRSSRRSATDSIRSAARR
jgi:hypothetical protein